MFTALAERVVQGRVCTIDVLGIQGHGRAVLVPTMAQGPGYMHAALERHGHEFGQNSATQEGAAYRVLAPGVGVCCSQEDVLDQSCKRARVKDLAGDLGSLFGFQ
ncbi:MAG TPA: hypothetical protein EYQ25_04465 [Planctomycetes bacterium]|nr:hypothetical protein [Planctomycetota bacterium]